MSICFNDNPENRKVIIEGERKCAADKDIASCPDGYTKIGLKQVPTSYIPYCFGDFIEKAGRFVAICSRTKTDSDYPNHDDYGCCTGKIEQKECRPGYCANSLLCKNVFKNKCYDTINVNSDECKQWCSSDTAKCSQPRFKYCSENNLLESIDCRNYADISDDKYTWDAEWTKYCQKEENSKKDICSCFDVKNEKWAGKPSCFNPVCSLKGYMTMSMKTTNCPSICQAIISGNAGNDAVIDRVNIVQQCGEKYNIQKNNNEIEKKDDETKKSSLTEKTSLTENVQDKNKYNLFNTSDNYLAYALIGSSSSVFFVMILLMIFFFIYFMRKNNK